MATNRKIILKLLTFVITLPFESWSQKRDCTFCRLDNVGVFFGPFVSVDDMDVSDRYNSSDLLPLLSKISSEFKIVAVTFPIPHNWDFVTYDVPKAVASWNAYASENMDTRTLEMIVYSEIDSLQTIQRLVKLIDEANNIHANTVTQLVHVSTSGNSNFFYNSLQEIRELLPLTNFKLGMVFRKYDSELLKQNGRTKNNASASLVDFVFFEFGFDEVSKSLPVEGYIKTKLDLAKDTSQIIRDTYNGEVSVGVAGSWPDSTKDGIVDYSRLVQFWKAMAGLAKSEGITVLLVEAFDNYFKRGAPLCGLGWWRLIENSSYTSTSEYLFEDKLSLVEKQRQKTPESLIAEIGKHRDRDNKNILIYFFTGASLFYAQTRENSDYLRTVTLVETLALRFSHLFLDHRSERPIKSRELLKLVPKVVAQRNTRVPYAPLQVSILVDTRLPEETVSLLEEVVSANDIYPNTVTQVIIGIVGNAVNFVSIHKIVRELLDSYVSTSNVKIGMMCALMVCRNLRYPEGKLFYKNLFWPADFIFFEYLPTIPGTKQGHQFGVDRLHRQTITIFERCRHNFFETFSGKAVGFHTVYDNKMESKNEDFTPMVIFWNKIDQWASKTNTQVILFEAFDSLDESTEKTYFPGTGWWKVIPASTGKGITFLEKRTVALEKLYQQLKNPNAENAEQSWLVPAILAIILVPIIIVFVGRSKRKTLNSKIHDYEEIVSEICKNENIILLNSNAFIVPETSNIIGTGNFGTVYKCYMSEFQTDVAIKIATVADNDDKKYAIESLVSEMKVLSHLGDHENVLRLLGVCLEANAFMVTELCAHGSLLKYLRTQSSENAIPSYYELLHYCMEISNGMWFLEQKKVIHGDLSARNVLLNENNTCKISDFGLSRKLEEYDKYMKTGDEALPFRWMAIESLIRKEFSSKSDVWSMGVTFWEVFSLGKIPFPEMTWDGAFCERLTEGLRLTKPPLADESVYKMMRSCWELASESRPSSEDIFHQLRAMKFSEYILL